MDDNKNKKKISPLISLRDFAPRIQVEPIGAWPRFRAGSSTRNVLVPDHAPLYTTQKSVSPEIVQRKIALIQAAGPHPPRVRLVSGSGRYWIFDGHHAAVAYLTLGLPIRATLYGPGPDLLSAPRFKRAPV